MIGLIDGNNLIYRYLFQSFGITEAAGLVVKNINELVENFNLDGLMVVWDGGSDRRKAIYPTYKETRSLTEQQKSDYLAMVKEIGDMMAACGILQVRVPGEEADDVIASLTRTFLSDDKILICSNDRDFYSLLSNRVVIWDWKEMRNLPWFRAEYKIEPLDWVKVKSLVGDTSDNVEGVAGIGVKKGLKIVQDGLYGDFEGRDDVRLYRQVLEFMEVPEEKIIEGMAIGKLDKFRVFQTMDYCHLDVTVWDKALNLARKNRVRRWKVSKIEYSMKNCRACELFLDKNNTVVFRGTLSDILLVGEAPGEDEDQVGSPFVGRAGRTLDKWFNSIGMQTQYQTMISNTVWHRPTKTLPDGTVSNRPPKEKEIEACSPKGIIPLIQSLAPKLIVALGGVAANFITGSKVNITKDCGRYKIERFGFPVWVWVMPHPASVSYNGAMNAIVQEQLKGIDRFIREEGLV